MSKFKVSKYQNEIDIREEEINRLKRTLMTKKHEEKLPHKEKGMKELALIIVF